tara:strand:+ start:418 stop:1074 length:657 start_codon:yes stop_codon:yes gene_type:complete
MSKCLKIDYISNYKNNNKIHKFVNQKEDECLICYETLNDVDIVMENNFCDCYHIVLLCGKCFKKWYMNDTRCFICRTKYMTYNEKKTDNVFLIDTNIRLRYLLRCRGFNNMRINYLTQHRAIVIPQNRNDLGEPIDTSINSIDSNDSIDIAMNISSGEDVENIIQEQTNNTNNTNIIRIMLSCNSCCRDINDVLIFFCSIILISSLSFIITFTAVRYL